MENKEEGKFFLHACIAYFVSMVLFVCLRVASGLGWFDLLADNVGERATDVVATVLIQIVFFLLVPLLIVKILSKQSMGKTLRWIGFDKPSGRVIGYAVLLGLLMYLFNMFVAAFSHTMLDLIGFRFSSGGSPFVGVSGLFIGILIVGVLPGMCEEVSNRGVLMRGIMSKLGAWRAVLLSSLIFGLMHLNIVQFFYAMVLGILIALAVLATRSLWTGVIIHFMNNAMSVFFSFAQSNDWVIAKAFQNFLNLFSGDFGFILYIGFAIGVYMLIMHILHKFAREGYKANEKAYFAEFLRRNPKYIEEKIKQGQAVTLDDMARTVESYVKTLSKMRATRFYLEGQHKPQKLKPLEMTMLFGIIFLTSVVTVMTLVWGLL